MGSSQIRALSLKTMSKCFIIFSGVSDNLVGTGLIISIDQEQKQKS